MTDATELVAEIAVRFKLGDSATELVARLEPHLTAIARETAGPAEVPADLRDQIASLLTRVRETVLVGEEWLARTGTELAIDNARQRLRRAYGLL